MEELGEQYFAREATQWRQISLVNIPSPLCRGMVAARYRACQLDPSSLSVQGYMAVWPLGHCEATFRGHNVKPGLRQLQGPE